MAIAVLAAVLRLGPIDLPREPDEQYVISNLYNFYHTKTLEPVHIINPPLSHYLCWITESVILKWKTNKPLFEAYAMEHFLDQRQLYRVCRGLHWFLAVATVPFLFWLAWRLYQSIPIALISGGMLAMSFSHIVRSRTALSNLPVALFFTVSLGFLFVAIKEKRRGLIYIGALIGGLSTSVKWNGAAVIIIVVVALWFEITPLAKLPVKRLITVLSLLMLGCLSILLIYLTGIWKEILPYFSDDGIVDPETEVIFIYLIRKMALIALGVQVLACFLFWRLKTIGMRKMSFQQTVPWKEKIELFLEKILFFLSRSPAYWAALFFLLGLVMGNPYIFFKQSISSCFIHSIMHVQTTGHIGMFGTDWIWYILELWKAEKLLGIFLVSGVVFALFRGDAITRVAAFFCIFIFWNIGSWEAKAMRYMIVILPLACLTSTAMLWVWAEKRVMTRNMLLIGVGIVFFFQIPQIYQNFKLQYKEDIRLTARQWIEQNVETGSRILVTDRVNNCTPQIQTTDELAIIHRHLTQRGMDAVEIAYRSSPVYHVTELECYSPDDIQTSSYDYFVIGSMAYQPYFDDAQLPPEGNLLREIYVRRRNFYEVVLKNRIPQLKEIIRFDNPDPQAMEIRIYRINDL